MSLFFTDCFRCHEIIIHKAHVNKSFCFQCFNFLLTKTCYDIDDLSSQSLRMIYYLRNKRSWLPCFIYQPCKTFSVRDLAIPANILKFIRENNTPSLGQKCFKYFNLEIITETNSQGEAAGWSVAEIIDDGDDCSDSRLMLRLRQFARGVQLRPGLSGAINGLSPGENIIHFVMRIGQCWTMDNLFLQLYFSFR